MSKLVSIVFVLNSIRSRLPVPRVRIVSANFPESTGYTGVLTDCVLDTVTGYVFSHSALVEECTSWDPQHAIRRMPFRPVFASKFKRNAPITFLGAEAYYHWLLEDLPAYLSSISQFPECRTGIRRESPRYVLDVLEILGRVPEVLPVFVKVPNLVLTRKSAALQPTVNNIQLLERLFLAANVKLGSSEKIYISRRDSGRYPENESEIESLVTRYDFEIVHLAELSLTEQMRLFSGATQVIGTHGAGLANIVWNMEKNCNLVEISREGQPNCFEKIAEIKGIRYQKVASLSKTSWIADLKKLEELLRTG